MPEPSPAIAPTLRDEILTRLDQAGRDERWPLLVLAALEGAQALEDALAAPGLPAAALAPPPVAPPAAPRAAYVTRVQAQASVASAAPSCWSFRPAPA